MRLWMKKMVGGLGAFSCRAGDGPKTDKKSQEMYEGWSQTLQF
jgi:hypothetical protein